MKQQTQVLDRTSDLIDVLFQKSKAIRDYTFTYITDLMLMYHSVIREDRKEFKKDFRAMDKLLKRHGTLEWSAEDWHLLNNLRIKYGQKTKNNKGNRI